MANNHDWAPHIDDHNLSSDVIGDKIKSPDELSERVMQIYGEVCGEYGRVEFETTTLPRAIKYMGRNYRTLVKELLKIIDEGGDKKPSGIDEYLRNILPDINGDYEERCTEYREDMIRKVADVVYNIDTFVGRCGWQCDVLGIAVYGSIARRNNHLWSDIDFYTITESDDGKQIGYVFEKELDKRGVVYHSVDEVYPIRDLSSLGGENLDCILIMSPHSAVMDKLQGHFSKINPTCKIEEYSLEQ